MELGTLTPLEQAEMLAEEMQEAKLTYPFEDEVYEKWNNFVKRAKEQGLVIVSGYSDDCVELDGALDDEAYSYSEDTLYINKKGFYELPEDCIGHSEGIAPQECKCKFIKSEMEKQRIIKAFWCRGDYKYCREFETDIPHASFDIDDTPRNKEDETKYCRAIIFHISELGDA
jgi:hypothetical protein